MHIFIRTSSLLCAAFASVITLSSAPAQAQGEKCVGIENDISRLQCFDGVFIASRVQKISASDAAWKLLDLVEYVSPDESMTVVQFGSGSCDFEFSLKQRRHPNSAKGSRQSAVLVSRADLRNVMSVGPWQSHSWGPFSGLTTSGLVLNYQRGHKGTSTEYRLDTDKLAPAVEIDPYIMKKTSEYSARDAMVFPLVTANRVDADKIRNALVQAVDACRNQ